VRCRLAALALSLIVLGVAAPAGAATPLRVRPVAPAAAVERLRRMGRPVPAVATPEIERALAARVQRWRSFHDVLSRPGVDWSPARERRHGPSSLARRVGATPAPGDEVAPETLRVALLRIDFSADRGGSASTGDGHFDLSQPGANAVPIDPAPHDRRFFEKHMEALSRYYGEMSYGRVKIIVDVWPRTATGAYSLSDMADYGPWEFSQSIYAAAVHMFRDMFFAADTQAIALGDPIPWDTYDAFNIVHAGGDLQSDVRSDSPEDIPSFTIGVGDTDVVIFPDSTNIPITHATIFPETQAQDDYYGAINGVVAHENGHNLFGFVDLYDTETGYPVVGYWSLMDSGNLLGSQVVLENDEIIYATGLLPPSVDPWQKPFITSSFGSPEVAYDGSAIAMPRIQETPECQRVTLSSDEYLLLENRWQAPPDTVISGPDTLLVAGFDQDSATHVVMGPGKPHDWDMLQLGSGILAWHVDESVIPYSSSLRVNADYGVNTDHERLGVSLLEADGLMDLGDPGSPYFLGAPFDPWYHSNNPVLSDSTFPPIRPHIGTRPHLRLTFPDDPDSLMHFTAARAWQRAGWPVTGDFPPGGPLLLAVDADGDGQDDVCWAGGRDSTKLDADGAVVHVADPDSAALFAIRPDGTGLGGGATDFAFAHLDARPRPEMAAIARGDSGALFAVSTYASGPDTTTPGGRVWLLDAHGDVVPGWPPALPSVVTTPPLYTGRAWLVGCANGRVYKIYRDGSAYPVAELTGPCVGRMAFYSGCLAMAAANGTITMIGLDDGGAIPEWSHAVSRSPSFDPDFLFIPLDGQSGDASTGVCGGYALVAHDADQLWAFCLLGGEPIPGWGHSFGDTIVAGLGAGDPDGDGLPEVLIQTQRSDLAFVGRTGYASPGWPKRSTTEDLRTGSPPLALDVDGDGRSEVVGMNASGIVAALRADGKQPEGWPLASGSGASGSPVAADLDHDGQLDLVVPDRFGRLFAYALPVSGADARTTSWRMLGGDPQRTCALSLSAAPSPVAASAGPLVAGSLKAYPNPARRKPVRFAYRLSEPAAVEFRILDTSAHEVASFAHEGYQGENVQVWDPGALPAGLYLARVRIAANGRERVEILPVGILR
jgi:M6 family metalloprotease-like protein